MAAPAPSATTITRSCLPVIDFSLLDESNGVDHEMMEAKVLQEWNDAFTKYGFCYLTSTSHNLSPLFQRVEAAALQFFTTLSANEKAAYYLGKGYGHGGYVAPGVERVAASLDGSSNNKPLPADPVESLCVHSAKAEHVPPFLPQDFCSFVQQQQQVVSDSSMDDKDRDQVVEEVVPYKYGLEFKNAVQELWQGLEALLLRIMTISAKALQLPDADSFFDTAFAPSGANFMRMAHYVDTDNNSNDHPRQERRCLRYGIHTDYSGFTLLWRNQSNGLQCAADMRQIIDNDNNNNMTRMPQSWIDVPVLSDDPHALVVNAGDLIQRWTNDYWVSNLHRVVAAAPVAADDADAYPANDAVAKEKTKKNEEPLSIVFFTGPALETKINRLPSPLLVNQPPKYNEVTAGDHLFQKLAPTTGV